MSGGRHSIDLLVPKERVHLVPVSGERSSSVLIYEVRRIRDRRNMILTSAEAGGIAIRTLNLTSVTGNPIPRHSASPIRALTVHGPPLARASPSQSVARTQDPLPLAYCP